MVTFLVLINRDFFFFFLSFAIGLVAGWTGRRLAKRRGGAGWRALSAACTASVSLVSLRAEVVVGDCADQKRKPDERSRGG